MLTVPIAAAGQNPSLLPSDIRRAIDEAHPGWRLAGVLPEIQSEILERTPTWPANLILGDYDGNGQTDVAVLVEYADAAIPGGRAVQLLAFLGEGQTFSRFVLEKAAPHDARQFLHLIRERPEGDAIGVEYEAIGGHAWRYRHNQWQSMPTFR